MKIGVLGTGAVGNAIASALVKKDHEVMMGSRIAGNEKGKAWLSKYKKNAWLGSFEEAAAFGELIFLCLNGQHAIAAINAARLANFDNKIVVDITNPLDFAHGMPPRLMADYSNFTSLAEEIQKLLSHSKVVKTLNTVTANIMVDARLINNGDHSLFICGDDADAKNKVKHFVVDHFYWKPDNLIDLGSLQAARTMEAYVPFWVTIMQALGTPMFNLKIVK